MSNEDAARPSRVIVVEGRVAGGGDAEDAVPPEEPTMRLDVGSLLVEDSPRLEGENKEHTHLLAEAGEALPPVLVHRPSMRVIDGVHRLQAAKLKGEKTIKAVFFDGDAEAAFVQAVKANITHGLPLTLAERRAAARRIVLSHPEWSDRAVAAVTGLAATTVRAIRSRVTDGSAQSHMRVGRDGKVRPLDPAEGRRRAAGAIATNPDAPLREIANLAGVSTGTVRAVRKRVRQGDDPVLPGSQRLSESKNRVRKFDSKPPDARSRSGKSPHADLTTDPLTILENLTNDPSLRYSEKGREVVRWLHRHLVKSSDSSRIAASVPPHCVYVIAHLAAAYANTWEQVAEALYAHTRTALEQEPERRTTK